MGNGQSATTGHGQSAITNRHYLALSPSASCRPLSTVRCLLLAVCCLLSASTVTAQTGTWVRQQTGTLAWLHSLFFLDQNRGWAVGSKGTLLATTDGGKTWKIKSRPSEDILRDIYFSDDLNGWIVCEKSIYDLKGKEEPRTYLMTTNDGGNRWTRVDIRGVEPDGRLVRAVFSPKGRGWAFGEGGAVFSMQDPSAEWVQLQSPTRHLLLGGTFIDDYRGWLVGAGATIIQTSDGGETWHVSSLPAAKGIRFNAASFVDNRLGWAVGSGGSVYRTNNGGRTWLSQKSGVSADLFDVKFLNASEGWAVGAEGTMIRSVDGGANWTIEPSETKHALERVFLVDRSHGWAVGFGGTILTYVRTDPPQLQR